MTIKEQVEWNAAAQCFSGYVDCGTEDEWQTFGFQDSETKAREALVVLATGIKGHWKIPLGYFLHAGCNGSFQASIITFALEQLYEIGCYPISLTFDGAPANLKTAEILGASLNIDDLKCSFPHPCNQDFPVYVLLDPCHMLKLIRNLLGSIGTIQIPGRGRVEWQIIVKLEELQRKEGLRLGNRLTYRHIAYSNQKMKVCYDNHEFHNHFI